MAKFPFHLYNSTVHNFVHGDCKFLFQLLLHYQMDKIIFTAISVLQKRMSLFKAA